jgi:hypothetical protein
LIMSAAFSPIMIEGARMICVIGARPHFAGSIPRRL